MQISQGAERYAPLSSEFGVDLRCRYCEESPLSKIHWIDFRLVPMLPQTEDVHIGGSNHIGFHDVRFRVLRSLLGDVESNDGVFLLLPRLEVGCGFDLDANFPTFLRLPLQVDGIPLLPNFAHTSES